MAVNGKAPTQEGRKLVARNYADKAADALGRSHLSSVDVMRQNLGIFDPDNVTLRDLERMREDPMIRLGSEITRALILRADWAIECEDPAIRAGMTEIVSRVYEPWMRTALNSLELAFQPAVKEYRLGKIDATYVDEGGQVTPVWEDEGFQPVVIGEPIPLEQATTRVKLKLGRFDGCTVAYSLSDELADDNNHIPAEWVLWFVHRFEERKRDWYGRSRIHSAYPAWYSYWFNWMNRDRHAEMDADPALQVWYPPGSYKDAEGNEVSNKTAALEIGDQLRGGATIAWPSDVHVSEDGKVTTTPLWRAEFLTGGENLGAFNDLLNDLRLEKLRASMVPEEVLTEALRGTGSRATSGNRIGLFTESLEQIVRDLDRMWNEHQLRPVVEANWGPDAPPVRKVTTGFQERDMALVGKLLEAAFNLDPNALPIDFESIMEMLDVPQISKREQMEREDAIAEQQAEQEALAAEQAAAAGGVLPGETPEELAASQPRSGPRKYETETIRLHGPTKASTAPGWARREGRRRDRNVGAISERMAEVVRDRYEDAFAAAVAAVGDEDELQLSVADAVQGLVDKVRRWISNATARHTDAVTGELASMYHGAGMAELNRLGLAAESWDVGRDEVQEWARQRAGELIKTIDSTVVEKHVRPFLTDALQRLGPQGQDGVPIGALDLAQEMSAKFAGYPEWMAERVVRTEAMRGYNLSAADMWERVGVLEVEMYDGLGGKSGRTDEACLARNGQRATLDEFRAAVRDEHPNGTLGAVPVAATADLRPLAPGLVREGALMSASIYGVTDEGLILSVAEVGRAMAG